jgi:hypothetical protein
VTIIEISDTDIGSTIVAGDGTLTRLALAASGLARGGLPNGNGYSAPEAVMGYRQGASSKARLQTGAQSLLVLL